MSIQFFNFRHCVVSGCTDAPTTLIIGDIGNHAILSMVCDRHADEARRKFGDANVGFTDHSYESLTGQTDEIKRRLRAISAAFRN